MKGILMVAIAMLIIPIGAEAKSASGGNHDYGKEQKYLCSETKKPGKVKWVAGSKLDVPNDRMIRLTWMDSFKAHKVEISYSDGITTNILKTDDDSKQKIAGLTNGRTYTFKVRGVSNCGKGQWSKSFQVKP